MLPFTFVPVLALDFFEEGSFVPLWNMYKTELKYFLLALYNLSYHLLLLTGKLWLL